MSPEHILHARTIAPPLAARYRTTLGGLTPIVRRLTWANQSCGHSNRSRLATVLTLLTLLATTGVTRRVCSDELEIKPLGNTDEAEFLLYAYSFIRAEIPGSIHDRDQSQKTLAKLRNRLNRYHEYIKDRDPPPLSDERRAVCAELAEALIEAIERWDKRLTQWYSSEDSRAGMVDGVVHAFVSISATKQLDWFLTHALADQRNYDLHQVLIPDVKAIYQWLAKVPESRAAATTLLEHCRSALRAATAHTIEPPADWAREAKLGCKCEDCQALSSFLRDPQARVGRFPIRKERRQHLHQQIDKHHCDCTHVTQRKGSPQTLVCTKTQASYERRLQQYKVDVMLLAEMDTLAKANEKSSRLSSAVKRRAKR